jgi:LuxR family maltose regulon positive regulatory protein
VTIISAPAGSGKTCLLRAWADRPGQRHRLAVLQVQRDQYDAQQFWLAVLDAVRHASAIASRAEPPAATPDFNAPAMVDRVLSELADARGGITLVIDDLHELNSPEAFSQLTGLLMNLPPQVHAMLTTRHDLQLRLHQLRLAGELAEIRAADLRFSERETRELLDASGMRCRMPERPCCTGGRKDGRRACGSRRSPWLVTPTRSGSSQSSPAATAR